MAAMYQPVAVNAETISPAPFTVTGYESGSSWTVVEIEGGNIGLLNPDIIRDGDLSGIIDLLLEHAEWTGAEPGIEIVARRVSEESVEFRQRVHGALVERTGRVHFNDWGYVSLLRSVLVPPDPAWESPPIREDEAVEIGVEAYRESLELGDAEVFVYHNPAVMYDVAVPTLYLDLPDDHDGKPGYSWRMYATAGRSMPHIVVVDARTGDTKLYATIIER
ncbi:MAG: hypothetical protein QNI99_04655 [Woeseiaceae bacterium]|nr:hypothetical protein [Woeseiaceae bacterium]